MLVPSTKIVVASKGMNFILATVLRSPFFHGSHMHLTIQAQGMSSKQHRSYAMTNA
jgi:hypothetical protein